MCSSKFMVIYCRSKIECWPDLYFFVCNRVLWIIHCSEFHPILYSGILLFQICFYSSDSIAFFQFPFKHLFPLFQIVLICLCSAWTHATISSHQIAPLLLFTCAYVGVA